MVNLKTCPDCSKIIVDDGEPHTCTPPTIYDQEHPLVASLLEADAARARPLETVALLRSEIEERSAIAKKWVALADERGARIIALEAELAKLKAVNRYQRGYSAGQAEGHARIADLEAMLREAGAALAIWKNSFPDQWDDDDEAILTKISAAGLLPKDNPNSADPGGSA